MIKEAIQSGQNYSCERIAKIWIDLFEKIDIKEKSIE